MKYFFTLFFFAPFLSFSQTREVRVDKFTGDSTVYTNEEHLSFMDGDKYKAHDLKFYVMKTKGTTAVIFKLKPLGVLSTGQDKFIYLKLASGDVLKFKNGSKYNVATDKEYLSAYAVLAPEDIVKLKTSNLSAVRVETSKFPLDYTIEENKKDLISKALIIL